MTWEVYSIIHILELTKNFLLNMLTNYFLMAVGKNLKQAFYGLSLIKILKKKYNEAVIYLKKCIDVSEKNAEDQDYFSSLLIQLISKK
jgi:hypothetical protein